MLALIASALALIAASTSAVVYAPMLSGVIDISPCSLGSCPATFLTYAISVAVDDALVPSSKATTVTSSCSVRVLVTDVRFIALFYK